MLRAAGLALVVVAALAVTASAARPPASSRYVGTTSQGHPISLRTTSDRRGLQMSFLQQFACNRGGAVIAQASYARQRPTIRADGTFSYLKRYTGRAASPPFAAGFTESQRVTGSFSKSRGRVSGRIADSVSDPTGLRCKVVVTFRAKRRP